MPITTPTSHISRRTALVAAASVLATGLGHARAAPHPNKLINLVVLFPPEI